MTRTRSVCSDAHNKSCNWKFIYIDIHVYFSRNYEHFQREFTGAYYYQLDTKIHLIEFITGLVHQS